MTTFHCKFLELYPKVLKINLHYANMYQSLYHHRMANIPVTLRPRTYVYLIRVLLFPVCMLTDEMTSCLTSCISSGSEELMFVLRLAVISCLHNADPESCIIAHMCKRTFRFEL